MYTLSEEDRITIQELLSKVNRSQTPVRSKKDVDDYVQPSPEVYIAKTPEDGIPALALDVPGSANCEVYQVSEFEPPFSLTPFPTGLVRALNLSTTGIDGDTWVLLQRERSGKWIVNSGGSEGSGCPTADSIGGKLVVVGGPGIDGTCTLWVCPACVTQVYVQCWGCGGRGASFGGSPTGGGGGGAYAAALITTIPGRTYMYCFANVPGDNYDVFFELTGIGSAVLVKAVTGKDSIDQASPNLGAPGGQASDCVGDIKYSGGHGGSTAISGGNVCYGGGGGGAGPDGPGGDGTNGVIPGDPFNTPTPPGGTGYSPGGNGANFASDNSNAPLKWDTAIYGDDSLPGGASSGGRFPATGEDAGKGRLVITWGLGVTALNDRVGSLYIADNTDEPLTVTNNKVISLPDMTGSGPPVSGTPGPIYFDVSNLAAIKFWYKKP